MPIASSLPGLRKKKPSSLHKPCKVFSNKNESETRFIKKQRKVNAMQWVEGDSLNWISPGKFSGKFVKFLELFLALASSNVDQLSKVVLWIVEHINENRPQKPKKRPQLRVKPRKI